LGKAVSERTADLPGRILAVDYGRRHVGIALTDPARIIASPLRTLRVAGTDDAFEQIGRLVEEHHVTELVVGLPRSLSGDEGPMAEEVRGWALKLGQVTGLPVHLVDERLTSREVDRMLVSRKERKRRTDHLAAALILRQFLEQEK
jgi:putative Holliday junction resolvase